MAIELRGFDDLQNDMVNMAYALDQGAGVNRALSNYRFNCERECDKIER